MEDVFSSILRNNITSQTLDELNNVLNILLDNEPPEWVRNTNLWNKQIVKTKIKKYIKNFANGREGEIRHTLPFHYDIIKKITFDIKKTQAVVLNLMKKHPGLQEIIFNEEDEYSIWPWWTSLITYLNIAAKILDFSFRNNRKIVTLNEMKTNYPSLTDNQARNIFEAINKAAKIPMNNVEQQNYNWYESICNDIHITRNVEVYMNKIPQEQREVMNIHNKYDSYIEFISRIMIDIINQITREPHRKELHADSDYFIFLDKSRKYVYFSEVEQMIDERYVNDYTELPTKREALKWLMHEGIRSFTVLFRWKDLIQWVLMINSYYSNTWMLGLENLNDDADLRNRINEFQGFVDSDSD